MKTLEDVLYDNTGMLTENHPSIVSAMKEYAISVAKEALKNASENAKIDMEYIYSGYDPRPTTEWTVNKTSILSETNIPDEVKL